MTATTDTKGTRGTLTVVAGLLVAGAADAGQGYDGPGPYLCWAVAALVALRPRRWTLAVAAGCCAFLLAGAFVTPEVGEMLSAPSDTFLFASTLVQLAGLAAGLAAGCRGAWRSQGRRTLWAPQRRR